MPLIFNIYKLILIYIYIDIFELIISNQQMGFFLMNSDMPCEAAALLCKYNVGPVPSSLYRDEVVNTSSLSWE